MLISNISLIGWWYAGSMLVLNLSAELLKLGFGFAMDEPLLFVDQSASLVRTSDGVAPDSRNAAKVTA